MTTFTGSHRNERSNASWSGTDLEHPNEWLNLCGAAKYVTKSERYMRQLVAERKITYYKHNRLLAFKRSDLDAWATSDRREALK